jgi:toxin ParE1/3/4
VSHRIEFTPEAQKDLRDLYDYIDKRAGTARANGYIDRIQRHCRSLATFPRRGTRRDDLRPGLRVSTFERRVRVAYLVGATAVVILRVLYAGRDLAGTFENRDR